MEIKNKIRVMLADDHELLITGFAFALRNFDIDVVAQANSPESTIQDYNAYKPDILLLDIRFGDQQTGLEIARLIIEHHPEAKIIFLSQFDQDSLISEAYRVGAKSFITKNCSPLELLKAIQIIHQSDEPYYLPNIAEKLAKLQIRGERSPRVLLDEKELKVFIALASGSTHADISKEMGIALKTVGTTAKRIEQKLQVKKQAEMTLLAVKYNLIVP